MKTGTLKQGALGWMFLLDRRLIVWSAHEFSTAQEAFRDMLELVEGTPELDRKVKAVHRANGDEAIEAAQRLPPEVQGPHEGRRPRPHRRRGHPR